LARTGSIDPAVDDVYTNFGFSTLLGSGVRDPCGTDRQTNGRAKPAMRVIRTVTWRNNG